jgi:hypothetical protein
VFTARTGTSNCVGERIDSTQKPGLLFTIDDSRSKPVIIPALAPWLGRLWYGRDRKGKKGWHRWQLFKETEPGHRFHTHYNSPAANAANGAKRLQVREALQPRRRARAHRRGVASLPTSGPSYIIIVIGLRVLAGELLPLTCLFDWADVKLRGLGQWIRALWTSSSTVVRVP